MDPMGKKSWGNPEFIEKMYLEHPIEPPDVLGFETNSAATTTPTPDLETRGISPSFSLFFLLMCFILNFYLKVAKRNKSTTKAK